jgi:N-acetylneuraminic acid mutarotase
MLAVTTGCKDSEPPEPEAPWQARADLPDPRLESSATALGTKLLVLGGFRTGDAEVPPLEITAELLQFDPLAEPTKAWTTYVRDGKPIEGAPAWTHAALVTVGGSLYLLGGLEGTTFIPSAKTYRLEPGATRWDDDIVADIPAGLERGAPAIVVSAGHIFLLGGSVAGNGFTASVLDYNVALNTWTERPELALPTARSHAAAMRDEDGTFVLAGGLGDSGALGDAWAFDPFTQMWQLRERMAEAHNGCAYGVVYGQLVCAGGATNEGASKTVEVYDPTVRTWTVVTEMPVARAGAAGAVVTSRLYVAGGSESTALAPTTSLLEFDFLDTIPR